MSTKQLIEVDSLDDRRTLWFMLDRLEPRDRVRFLQHACSMAPRGTKGELPIASVYTMQEKIREAYRCDQASDSLTNELYCDLLTLANQWGLDLVKTAIELERFVTRPDYRKAVLAASSRGRAASRPAS